jgi:hypothetical protein
MSSPELLAGLRACLGEAQPSSAERAALSAQLGSVAGLPELADVANKLASAQSRSEIAVAAARVMRVLMQAEALAQPEASEADKPKRSRREAQAERRQAVLEKKQAEAIETRAGKSALEQPVETIPGVGRALGLAFRSRGIATIEDLVWLLPLGYHDEREITPIDKLVVGERQVTEGRVTSARMASRRMAEVWLEDPEAERGSGARLRLTWFPRAGRAHRALPRGRALSRRRHDRELSRRASDHAPADGAAERRQGRADPRRRAALRDHPGRAAQAAAQGGQSRAR